MTLYQNEPLAFQVQYNGDYGFVLDSMRWKTLDVPDFLRKHLKKEKKQAFEILFTARTNGSPYYRSAGLVYPSQNEPDQLASYLTEALREQVTYQPVARERILLNGRIATRVDYRITTDEYDYQVADYFIKGHDHVVRLLFSSFPEKPIRDADMIMGQMPMVRVGKEAEDIIKYGFAPYEVIDSTRPNNPFDLATQAFDRNANYGGALQALQEEASYYRDSRLKQIYGQALATWQAALQEYGAARKSYLSMFATHNPASSAEQQATVNELQVHPAVETILAKANSAQILILNEAHHDPAGRALLQQLLPGLHQLGYRHLGLEALNPEDTTLAYHGFPTIKTGFYISEPQFTSTLRTALDLQYEVFAYESTVTCKPPMDAPPRYCQNQRDRIQAEQIAAYLEENPGEKMVILCGFQHVEEKARQGWVKMAEQLRMQTGIDPLTVDQVYLSGNQPNAWYHAIRETQPTDEAVTFHSDQDTWLPAIRLGYTDLLVYHPEYGQKEGYPEWFAEDKIWKTLDLRETEAVQGGRWLQIFYENEWAATKEAVPVLQVPAQRMKPFLRVPLPTGTFTLVLRDLKGNVRGEMPLRVAQENNSTDN